ncbi:MAG: hypothetical protein KDD48_03555 [Bdellovibrionales bacterium]|nr:hypothetical protein [Bdellovibrionales bacterium]
MNSKLFYFIASICLGLASNLVAQNHPEIVDEVKGLSIQEENATTVVDRYRQKRFFKAKLTFNLNALDENFWELKTMAQSEFACKIRVRLSNDPYVVYSLGTLSGRCKNKNNQLRFCLKEVLIDPSDESSSSNPFEEIDLASVDLSFSRFVLTIKPWSKSCTDTPGKNEIKAIIEPDGSIQKIIYFGE